MNKPESSKIDISALIIDLAEHLPDPQPIVRIWGNLIASRGNVSTVVGLAKSRKTFLTAAIASGFDYAVGGVTYHFSYDTFDQQNFADTANVCLMKQSGMPGLPDSVTWNAYTPGGELERLTFDASGFLALYAGGAMKHKNETMQRGGERKAAVEAATTPEEVEAA